MHHLAAALHPLTMFRTALRRTVPLRAPRCWASASSVPCARLFASLPEHTVVGLPSLSPTMTAGTIASWTVEAGTEVGPGDVFCEIETDKATVDFECQDDAFVAKILVDEGTEVPTGTPVMVLVEEEEHVAAFADFVADAAPAPSPAPAAEEAPAPPAAAAAAAAAPTPVAAAPTSAPAPTGAVWWGPATY